MLHLDTRKKKKTLKIKYSKKLLLILTFIACNHAILSMNKQNKTAIQIKKHIYDNYINTTLSSIQQMELTKNENITNLFRAYLQTNKNIQTLSENTKITSKITKQFEKKKKQKEAKLVSAPLMCIDALEDFCDALESSPSIPYFACLTFIVSFSDNIRRNRHTKEHVSILDNLKNIFLQNLIPCYTTIKLIDCYPNIKTETKPD